MQGSIRWLYLPNEPHVQSDSSGTGHGTCVASKVASPTFGVAKSANIVVVKLQPVDGLVLVSHMISAWGVVAADIASQNLYGIAVVLTTANSEQ